ncbi:MULTISPECIES: pilus assembly protein PilX [Pseudoalteromonas]|uniref:Pilus assembly protein PilX n=1 Tax=Pseudoalteromonas amylolytica TaxID=1859457 RepID=A0A1S1MQW5_9GAMM|nr:MULTISPECIES: pilus assembly protein PilX [Pseudoalteromonas]MCF6436321.1 pilus assembly protein PilX [Pseudoalteromonas sp. MMG022]OHU86756.1 pilus assembly protein PilX [Pseudoalteromonas sp. JW3]OHU88719.1 pilus assembly protein PilX [Pseudoalteromonas amylolytica]
MALVKQQRGIVLITAMIMIVAVTAIAVTLMSTSSIDLKITNAAQEREEAESLLMGEVQRAVAQQAALAEQSLFTFSREQLEQGNNTFDGQNGATNRVTSLNNGPMEISCPRSYSATNGLICNMTQLETTINYGSKDQYTITVVTGVGQEMLSVKEGR